MIHHRSGLRSYTPKVELLVVAVRSCFIFAEMVRGLEAGVCDLVAVAQPCTDNGRGTACLRVVSAMRSKSRLLGKLVTYSKMMARVWKSFMLAARTVDVAGE